jgi:hypothetical protein
MITPQSSKLNILQSAHNSKKQHKADRVAQSVQWIGEWLDNRRIMDRFPARVWDLFLLLNFHSGHRANPFSFIMCIRTSFFLDKVTGTWSYALTGNRCVALPSICIAACSLNKHWDGVAFYCQRSWDETTGNVATAVAVHNKRSSVRYVRSCQILQRGNNKSEHLTNIIMYLTVTEVTPPNVSKHSLKLKAIHFSMLVIVLMLLTYIRCLPHFQKIVSFLHRNFVFSALHDVLKCKHVGVIVYN